MYKYGAILLTAALVLWAPTQAAAQDRRDWDWQGRVDRGDAIEIKGINGEILAERGSGNEVVVRVQMK